jgi:hypothetical protein
MGRSPTTSADSSTTSPTEHQQISQVRPQASATRTASASALVAGFVALRLSRYAGLNPMMSPPTSATTRVDVLVLFGECTKDRSPKVAYRRDAVSVEFTGKGFPNCTGDDRPPVPRTVELREPLGDRKLVDANGNRERFPQNKKPCTITRSNPPRANCPVPAAR